jgi:hypothetical protein
MRFFFGGLVILFMVALAAGALTGRVRARNCCSMSAAPADARLAEPTEHPDQGRRAGGEPADQRAARSPRS